MRHAAQAAFLGGGDGRALADRLAADESWLVRVPVSLRFRMPHCLTVPLLCYVLRAMDAEQIIAEIESLEHIFTLSDTRPLTSSDISAANRRHDEMHGHSPWFRLWQTYGICCRPEPPVSRLRLEV